MTFISVIIDRSFLSITADKRVTRLMPDGSCGEILNEDTEKISMVGTNGFYSITGAANTALEFMQTTDFIGTVFSRRGIIREKKLQEWLEENLNLLITEQNSFQLIFGGLTAEGSYKIFDLNSEDGILETLEQGGKENYKVFPSHHFAGDENDPKQWLEKMVSAKPLNSVAEVQNLQARLNTMVARHDPSVNDIPFNVTIHFR